MNVPKGLSRLSTAAITARQRDVTEIDIISGWDHCEITGLQKEAIDFICLWNPAILLTYMHMTYISNGS